jgi:hypothetical protein
MGGAVQPDPLISDDRMGQHQGQNCIKAGIAAQSGGLHRSLQTVGRVDRIAGRYPNRPRVAVQGLVKPQHPSRPVRPELLRDNTIAFTLGCSHRFPGGSRSRRRAAAARRTISGMGLIETSVALVGCMLVLGVGIILDRRPYHPGKLNYIPLMIIALAAILVLGRHLVTLL